MSGIAAVRAVELRSLVHATAALDVQRAKPPPLGHRSASRIAGNSALFAGGIAV